MLRGTIKKLVMDKGFGFISAQGGDVFFHLSSLADANFDELQEGQAVEYEVEKSEGGGNRSKGPRAATVRVV
jgi:CspA family cold shock protein